MPRGAVMWPPREWWRTLAQFAGFCLVITVCLSALVILPSEWRGWRWVGINFAIAYLYSFEIGAIAFLVTPAVARRVWHWSPFSRWAALIVAFTATGIVGTLVGTLGLLLLDLGPFWPLFGRALRLGVPVTLIVGVLVTVLESSKERLQAAELSLRTQQLERERAEKLAAEARLASLTSRVQPHFLFNTLNSVAALVRENPREAEVTIERLSGLLRSSLDPSDAVPLERELRLVGDYLHIQQTRFGRRLRFHIEAPPTVLEGARVPPFSVQTLVENSVKHVAGQSPSGVDIGIVAGTDEDKVIIDVTDSGPGFAPDAIPSGHGLDALQARLRSLHGDAARIEYERGDGRMTVRLILPR